ncbi:MULTISPECIES: IS3 family transposase [Streptomyces]|uniref:IS3 family transposase n=1 Tax=Streptomyces TaxID=1883 RepID=UPI003570B732
MFEADYRVYGARKIRRGLNRQGHAVARCTVERLMYETGIAGIVRGKKVITTILDPGAARAPNRLDRESPKRPTAPGSPTSRTSPPGRVSSTSPLSWTPGRCGRWGRCCSSRPLPGSWRLPCVPPMTATP